MNRQRRITTTQRLAVSAAVMALLFSACRDHASGPVNTGGGDNKDWLIPSFEVIPAAGKDEISSIDDPEFAALDRVDYVLDERRVVGVMVRGEVKVYPHQILDWHEIVNDVIGDRPIALTYCPLTNTAIGWKGYDGEFGVSGFLFHNNLMPYDRGSGSYWSQMQMRSVHGPKKGNRAETFDVVETTWSPWKKMYPDSKVLTTNTGFALPYGAYEPYGINYLTDDSQILFTTTNDDNRLANKDRIHGVIVGSEIDEETPAKAYPIKTMGEGVQVINDRFEDTELVVVGSTGLDFMASFERTLDDTLLVFEPVQNRLPVVMEDQEGTEWDVFGNAVSGPRQGQKLTSTRSFTGFWFAWTDFFPDIELYQR